MSNARHVLGISGGKDSAALAIYLRNTYPNLEIDYYFSDTGKELAETYEFIENLEIYLGKKVTLLRAAAGSTADPFDHFLTLYGGFLPSGQARWCTKDLKLRPFERYVGAAPTLSYVAIRGDEDREGYISKKPNIQAIFPFRRNIWSKEIIQMVLNQDNLEQVLALYEQTAESKKLPTMLQTLQQPMSDSFNLDHKLNTLFDLSLPTFNKVTYALLKETSYPISFSEDFPLLEDENIITRDDVFQLEVGFGVQ